MTVSVCLLVKELVIKIEMPFSVQISLSSLLSITVYTKVNTNSLGI